MRQPDRPKGRRATVEQNEARELDEILDGGDGS
jgi:hypothetical protein